MIERGLTKWSSAASKASPLQRRVRRRPSLRRVFLEKVESHGQGLGDLEELGRAEGADVVRERGLWEAYEFVAIDAALVL